MIPLAALAGVLMVTAVRMVDRRSAMSILRSTRSDALVMILTAAATVVFDLILAVEIGIAVAAVLALRADGQEQHRRAGGRRPVDADSISDDEESRSCASTSRSTGSTARCSSARPSSSSTSSSASADVRVVILRLGGVRVIDASGGHALEEIIVGLQAKGIAVLLCGVGERPMHILEAVGAIDALGAEHHVFTSLPDAIAHAQGHVRRHLTPGE